MVRKSFLLLLALAISISCGGSQPGHNSNTELTVHYNGKLVHHRKPKPQSDYTSYDELSKLISEKQDFIVIFSADWCSACKLTKKAIIQAEIKKRIYYLNVDENWVQQLMAIMEVRSIPFMVHTNNNGDFVKALNSPKDIVLYLLLNYS
jgi:thiol:disulfide interchange protein